MTKGTIQREGMIFINSLILPSTPKYIKRILTDPKESIQKTIILRVFNTSLSPSGRSFRQHMYKNKLALNDTSDQMDLTDTCRRFCPKAREFFLSTYGLVSRTDQMFSHIISIDKFKKTELLSRIIVGQMA